MPDLFDDDPSAPGGGSAARGKTPEDLAKGHRERLRARFMGGGAAAVADYELLELVLFRAIPRRDVKPLAKRLLERFDDFAGVISAEPARLREVAGLGDAAIVEFKIVQSAAQALARGRVRKTRVLGDPATVEAYCRATMGHGAVEEFRVLFLNSKNGLIADERQSRGTVDQVAVYPREVVKRAIELGATALILAHNHPSGDPTPSQADRAITRKLVEIATALGIQIHDHVVIGTQGAFSFRGSGLL